MAEPVPETNADDTRALNERVARADSDLLRHKLASRPVGEETFRSLADAAPVMIWVASADGLYNFLNKAWLEFRGRTMEQEVGNGWAEGLYPDDRDLCLATYRSFFAARQPFRMEYRLRRFDGEYRWVEDNGLPRHEEGVFYGFVGAAVDVRSRKPGIFMPDEEAVRIVFSLTERERQVLALVAEGKSTKETAASLGISYKTADSHRSRILEKLGVHETASMVRYAIRAGLITP
jgi:PAS domain S-box-containing protein